LAPVVDESEDEETTPQPATSASASSIVNETVETNLAPVANIDKENPAIEDDGRGWTVVERKRGRQHGKSKAIDDDHSNSGNVETVREPSVEPASNPSSSGSNNQEPPHSLPLKPRVRGCRGHGHGRGSRRAPVAGDIDSETFS
jgi:hypothetical protein